MGRISAQQIRVFGFFSVAFVLTAMAHAYEALGHGVAALAMAAAAFAFICSVILEGQRS